jgi:hypothetical protein
MKNLYWDDSGNFYLKKSIRGKEVTRSLKTTDPEEAEKRKRAMIQELLYSPSQEPVSTPTYNDGPEDDGSPATWRVIRDEEGDRIPNLVRRGNAPYHVKKYKDGHTLFRSTGTRVLSRAIRKRDEMIADWLKEIAKKSEGRK